jgi:hypothetical protein
MNSKFRIIIITGPVLLLAILAAVARAETTVASSVEWLACSSEIIAVGKIINVKSVQGPGAVTYEDCTFSVTELLKSPAPADRLTFTFRALDQDAGAVAWPPIFTFRASCRRSLEVASTNPA